MNFWYKETFYNKPLNVTLKSLKQYFIKNIRFIRRTQYQTARPPPPEVPGTKLPSQENTGMDLWLHCICSRGWPCQVSMGGEALGPVKA